MTVGLAGCADVFDESGTARDADRTPRTDEPDARPPDLLALAGGATDGMNLHAGRSLARLAYDDDAGRYQVEARYSPPDDRERITAVDGTADGIVVDVAAQRRPTPTAERSRLVALDGDLSATASVRLDGVHAVATDARHVYTASADGFFVFDGHLSRVGKAPLPGAFDGKHLEDVVVHGEVAYVVDDVYKPLYLLRVDLASKLTPRFLDAVDVAGVNPTLGQQWLRPGADRWFVLQWTADKQGTAQNVVWTSMGAADTGSGDVGGIPVRADSAVRGWQTFWKDRESGDVRGTRIDDVTDGPPAYASIAADGSHSLATVRVDTDDGDDPLAFEERVRLSGSSRVAGSGRHVCAVSTAGSPTDLLCYDVEAEAVVTDHEVDLADPLALTVLDA
jgi:hypothetical protein